MEYRFGRRLIMAFADWQCGKASERSRMQARACFADFTFPRGSTLEVGSLSAEGCGSTGSVSGAGWSITISTTSSQLLHRLGWD
jgi:hypothetical protein